MGEARESELTKIEPSNSVSVSTQIGDKLNEQKSPRISQARACSCAAKQGCFGS